MANYIASDTDLTAVADAIRTKGGTSADLTFPSGFVSAIQAIPTGGGSWKAATGSFTPTQIYNTNVDVKITDDTTIGFTPTMFILALKDRTDVSGVQYAMLASVFFTVATSGTSGNQYRASFRYSNTSNGLNINVYKANAWTTAEASILNYSSGNIRFRASAGYMLMNKEYTWFAFAPST